MLQGLHGICFAIEVNVHTLIILKKLIYVLSDIQNSFVQWIGHIRNYLI